MTEEKKKGILSKLFGTGKSSCCDVKIEEVTEDKKDKDDKKGDSDKKTTPPKSSCCG